MTSLTEDTVLAPSWPLGDLDVSPPVLGDSLVARKKTPVTVKQLWDRGPDGPDNPWEGDPWFLCGTEEPGDVRLECLHTERDYSHYAAAGLDWDEAALAYAIRPFIGSPEYDPLVWIPGQQAYRVSYSLPEWERELLGNADNEPADYDGYVGYVTGRSPGLDGKTYGDGRTDDSIPTLAEIEDWFDSDDERTVRP